LSDSIKGFCCDGTLGELTQEVGVFLAGPQAEQCNVRATSRAAAIRPIRAPAAGWSA
jgi:hypothetical protein